MGKNEKGRKFTEIKLEKNRSAICHTACPLIGTNKNLSEPSVALFTQRHTQAKNQRKPAWTNKCVEEDLAKKPSLTDVGKSVFKCKQIWNQQKFPINLSVFTFYVLETLHDIKKMCWQQERELKGGTHYLQVCTFLTIWFVNVLIMITW